MNPTFSPKEKIIRGICYGQAGDTEMYKYKWRGRHIDTLEFIAYQKRPNGEKLGNSLFFEAENQKLIRTFSRSLIKSQRNTLGLSGTIGLLAKFKLIHSTNTAQHKTILLYNVYLANTSYAILNILNYCEN
jgi:hypothetical protein